MKYILLAIVAVLFFTPVSHAYLPDKRPNISPTEAARALGYYFKKDPVSMRALLKVHGITFGEQTTRIHGETRQVRRELNNLPDSFTQIEAINRASSLLPYEDRDAIYREAGRFIEKDLTDVRASAVTHAAERFCGKHFRRIGEKEAFGACLFRHIATLDMFTENTEQCTRDIDVLLSKDAHRDEQEREIYLCVRKKGWRDPENAEANIDLPVVRDY